VAPKEGLWPVGLRLTINTSLAQVRQLAELGEKRQHKSAEPETISETVKTPH